MPQYNWNIVESDVKHNNPNPFTVDFLLNMKNKNSKNKFNLVNLRSPRHNISSFKLTVQWDLIIINIQTYFALFFLIVSIS
jgi:hypothetical protein